METTQLNSFFTVHYNFYIMNILEPIDVEQLKMNDKEKEHKSRNRLGYHVFLSRYVEDFKLLPIHIKRHLIFENLHINLFPPDDQSIDSTNSILLERVPYQYVMKSACREWSIVYSNQLKQAWKKRALKLNRRKLPGKFIKIPREINDSVNTKLMQSLTYEWQMLVRAMKFCITRPPRIGLCRRQISFGKERVTLMSQAYREMPFSYLLELTIFGQNYSKLNKKEIILNGKKTMLLHISSKQRMNYIFKKEASCATEFTTKNQKNNIIHGCCGKVNILRNGQNVLGYILAETKTKWHCLLATNELIKLDVPTFNKDENKYIFPINFCNQVTMYWPIRILLRKNGGGFKITLNRIAYKNTIGTQKIIVPKLSS